MSDHTSYEMEPEIEERVIEIARVAKVVKGGRRFSFRVTIVAGEGMARSSRVSAEGSGMCGVVMRRVGLSRS